MTDRDLPATEAVPETATGNDAATVKTLAPGFRFNPTDEELISNYLKKKVQRKAMRFYEIGEINVYKIKPSELPGYSRLNTEESSRKDQQHCFFFTALEKDKTTGAYKERATNVGYWEQTGEDKKILGGDGKLIGVMKSLVFHVGCAPNGWRTDWWMRTCCAKCSSRKNEVLMVVVIKELQVLCMPTESTRFNRKTTQERIDQLLAENEELNKNINKGHYS
ncbi:unnamed protein product [Microthlaspi erraticum]|uniref:NAC domain-containing protein n=1 Tax=Microthlaspi erraticum TaxID=1685480 RepID=A0A6D2JUI0_9BRAS|nr:unnamed protein product [Microthlaspi erraticum]